jgi:DNA recombination protein RmuC
MSVVVVILLAGLLLAVGLLAMVCASLVRTRPRVDASGLTAQVAQAAGEAQQRVVQELIDRDRAQRLTDRELSAAELDRRGEVFGTQMRALHGDLAEMRGLVTAFEDARSSKLDVLRGVLEQQQAGIDALSHTTQGLREALSSSKARGQWGERMAEDVLRLAGFLEGVQYRKQKAVAGGSGIPDFTFLLPRGAVLYMDVKFPLDNYLRYLDAANDVEERRYRDAFLSDVKSKVKELADRKYTDSEADTVDCVLLFIPNEQLYGFIQEHASTLLDDALKAQVVMCSPLTLFAVLAVVRQAVDNFRLERTANEILDLLARFRQQWEPFVAKMDTVGTRLEQATKAYDDLAGTRRRQLERQLDAVEELRHQTEEIPGTALAAAPSLALDV